MKRDLVQRLVFLVAGIYLLVSGIPSLGEMRGSKKWPSVEGIVIQSEVVEESPDDP